MTTTRVDPALLAERLDSFAGVWRMLARLLLEPPDAGLVERLSAPGMIDSWPLEADEPTTRGTALLRASVATEDEATLRLDHARLLVGPGPLPAAPYESVHRTHDRLVFDRPTFEVRAAYLAFGLQAPRLNREPDDHLGLELSFLAALCARALDAIEHEDELTLDTSLVAHEAFLRDHVLQWAPAYLRLLEQHAGTDFYRGWAALGLGALDQARAAFAP
ncbi:molecular chaperone TorD family protein [Actinotalea sp. K2]|uniref:TorD/DmsD family molecular chaperone n=1 Tax=Actinotalea sp. K2 TaxID=2939438 RepID=UPI002017AFBD|nr:molecular chaperone TorD family protein [Actinotalea sp. K2]MCL3860739.1 molecular chaperone TorD family protein [Actinotalea sp. K2]